ncbi:MAG: YifB family Mg chelatase-like AAA ATPase [Rickettsiales bacterium]|jgi:magnesium chelatase family protein|nr:YifB family Mg chelatase-like AAA ATPase [Rickettsiales bacterium]
MYTRALSVALYGVETLQIEIQCQLTNDQPGFQIVGLGSKAISEAKERVKASINSLGIALPCQRIIINLAPSALIKEGSHYDLPIILAILAAMKIIRQSDIENKIFAGEISLNAEIKPTHGILPIAIYSVKAEKEFFCPIDNYEEAYFSGNQKIFAISNILQLIKFFKGEAEIINPRIAPKKHITNINNHDFSEISGHEIAKRALTIAASGKHNLLMIGPPGCGKTMLAERFTSILPEPDANKILETSMIYSIAGKLPKGLKHDIPFRAPHHTASNISIIGGGKSAKPGEISLAHNGILFLDELPEFNQATIDSLRQPIESGEITISRAEKIVNYPASFQLIAAMNPCKCGNFFEDNNTCSQVPFCAKKYMQKISGPILDRFDIIIKLSYQKLSIKDKNNNGETSFKIRESINRSRKLQKERLSKYNISDNSQMTSRIIKDLYSDNDVVNNFINKLNDKNFTSRSIFKIIKLGQTIADLGSDCVIQKNHLLEALSYKNFIIK